VLDRVFELTVRLAEAMQQDQAARELTRARATTSGGKDDHGMERP